MGISFLLFIKLYLIDVSLNINSLIIDIFNREGGDDRIRRFDIGRFSKTLILQIEMLRPREFRGFPKPTIGNQVTETWRPYVDNALSRRSHTDVIKGGSGWGLSVSPYLSRSSSISETEQLFLFKLPTPNAIQDCPLGSRLRSS